MEHTADEHTDGTAQDVASGGVAVVPDPGPVVGPADRIRAAVVEAGARGAPMVSAQIMQAKLFSVYDDAAAVPEALALVQRHLGLTLDRNWYSAQEVEQLADQLDWLLGLSGPAGPGDPAEQDERAESGTGDGPEAAGPAAGE